MKLGARFYDPEVGRFISQDSYLGESTTPPSLNRYLYVYGNPTVFIDLDGRAAGLAGAVGREVVRQSMATTASGGVNSNSNLTSNQIISRGISEKLAVAGQNLARVNQTGNYHELISLNTVIVPKVKEGLTNYLLKDIARRVELLWYITQEDSSGGLHKGASLDKDYSPGLEGYEIDPNAQKGLTNVSPGDQVVNSRPGGYDQADALGDIPPSGTIDAETERLLLDPMMTEKTVIRKRVGEAAVRIEIPDASTNGKVNRHHSDPNFMGGDSKQKLTDLAEDTHKQLHKDMNNFLKTKTDDFGNHMRPQSGNSGADIAENFTRSERLDALAEFYKGQGSKYTDAANDFFKQHPQLK